VGGIIGAILLLTVFDWALIILSSMIGGAFFADGVGSEKDALLIFVGALTVGVIVQSLQLRRTLKGERPAQRQRQRT